ncbi:hypothetical protein [Clostridium sp.]|uniref:hypothetical protein n=1 Tax=Clostridium sp. TaxID=1506 RepID=UPI001A39CBB0|nr:hypothetical protein [Clostridium sp.]MBK5239963.1 hypothetical protein [Clostridium sp.]
MKKRHLLVIALIISLLFGAYNFIVLKEQKKNADELFIFCLSNAQANFTSDYSEFDDNDIIFYYMHTCAYLHTAVYTFGSTSYASIENHKQLSDSISELLRYMEDIDRVESRWKGFPENWNLINEYLHYIVINPNDKKNTEALYKLSHNLLCDLHDVVINYEGTSPNWTVDYKIDGNEEAHDTYYTIKYIGKGDDKVEDVNYSIDSSNEGEEGEFTLDNTMVHTGKLKFTVGMPKSTDRDITIDIEWNGKKETLILNKSK